MPKTSKAKKKVSKVKSKPIIKTKAKAKVAIKPKIVAKGPIKISKTYIPKDTEKYMCEKHKVFFRIKLQDWKKELVRANNEALYNGSMDDNSVSADIVDQASSYTDKNVEMKAINRQIKLISEIDKALSISEINLICLLIDFISTFLSVYELAWSTISAEILLSSILPL